MPPSMPLWVPGILLVLLSLGYRQSRARTVRPATLLVTAVAMFVFSLYGVRSAFGPAPLPVLAWLVAYVTVVACGAGMMSAGRMTLVGRQVGLPGSWVPMGLLLGIFAVKFTLGFAAGTHAPVLHQPWFVFAASAALGALSGGFGARAAAVRRFAQSEGTA